MGPTVIKGKQLRMILNALGLTLNDTLNFGPGRGFPTMQKWRDDVGSYDRPISPSSPRNRCNPSPWNSCGGAVDGVKSGMETDSSQPSIPIVTY